MYFIPEQASTMNDDDEIMKLILPLFRKSKIVSLDISYRLYTDNAVCSGEFR